MGPTWALSSLVWEEVEAGVGGGNEEEGGEVGGETQFPLSSLARKRGGREVEEETQLPICLVWKGVGRGLRGVSQPPFSIGGEEVCGRRGEQNTSLDSSELGGGIGLAELSSPAFVKKDGMPSEISILLCMATASNTKKSGHSADSSPTSRGSEA